MTNRDVLLDELRDAQTEAARQAEIRRTYWRRLFGLAVVSVLLIVFVGPVLAMPGDRRPADGLCEWSAPGAARYMLPLEAAVDRLQMIPPDVRERLKARLRDPRKHLAADDNILIGRDAIEGETAWWSLHDMNGGRGQVCWGEVTRSTWDPLRLERALVFCEAGHCLAYASVCRNIARALIVAPRRPRDATPGPLTPEPRIDIDLPTATLEPPTFAMAKTFVPAGSSSDSDDAPSTWEDVPDSGSWRRMSLPSQPLAAPLNPTAVPTGYVSVVPEPSTYALVLLGLALVILAARRARPSCP